MLGAGAVPGLVHGHAARSPACDRVCWSACFPVQAQPRSGWYSFSVVASSRTSKRRSTGSRCSSSIFGRRRCSRSRSSRLWVPRSRCQRSFERAVNAPLVSFAREGHEARPGWADLPVCVVFGTTVLLLHVLPIVTLLARSLRAPDGTWTFEHYTALLTADSSLPIEGSALGAIGLSLRISAVAAALAMVLGMLIALVLSRRPGSRTLRRGMHLFDGLVMLPLGVSAVTLGFGLLLTMHQPLGIGFDLRTSIVLIPIAQALVALPLVVRTLLPVLRGIDHRLRIAATSLGASPLTVLRTIDLPMLGRSAGLALGFAFAVSLGSSARRHFLFAPVSRRFQLWWRN